MKNKEISLGIALNVASLSMLKKYEDIIHKNNKIGSKSTPTKCAFALFKLIIVNKIKNNKAILLTAKGNGIVTSKILKQIYE